MEKYDRDLYIQEYLANIDLFKHDVDLRQARNQFFLTINMLLLGGITAVLTLNISQKGIVLILLGVIGIPICTLWAIINSRNSTFIKLRRLQLRKIEHQLGQLSTFENEDILRRQKYLAIKQPEIKVGFEKIAQSSSVDVEGAISYVLTIVWIVIIAIGVLSVYTKFQLL